MHIYEFYYQVLTRRTEMKSQKVIALLLSTALSISTCVPLGSITALGAEAGTTAQAVEVQEEVSDSAESAESPEEEEASATEETVAADEQEAASQETATEETENTEENVTDEVEDDSNESADETEAAVPAQEAESPEADDNTGSEEADTAASEETAVPAEEPVQSENVENSTDITAPALTETVETEAQNSVDASASVDFSNAEEIKAGESHKVDITEEGGSVLFRFVPEETAAYSFYSDENSGDPRASLYDADKSLIGTWDDQNGNNFYIQRTFEKGETYYFEAEMYSGTGSYSAHLIKDEFYAEYATGSNRTVFLNDEVTLEVRAFSNSALSYQWYDIDNEEKIEGATSAAYTFTAQKNASYRCHVSDENGNYNDLYFNIYIDNRLKAYVIDEYGDETAWPTVNVAPNGSAELNVTVSADDMTGLTYKWSDSNGNPVEGAGNTTCTIGPVTQNQYYEFYVYDQYGNSSNVTFYVRVQNHLEAYTINEYGDQTGSSNVYVAPHGSAELNVTVSADDMTGLTYEWRDDNGNLIEGAGNTTCTIGPVTGYEQYNFRVYDQYGNSRSVYFYVYVQNHLEAYFIDDEGGQHTYPTVYVAPNESTELSVTVSAEDMTGLTYEWRDGKGNLIEGAGNTTCAIGPVTQNQYYDFFVDDPYGNSRNVSFYVCVQNHLEAYTINEYGNQTAWPDVYVTPNGSTELNVTVSADDMTGLTYEWRDGNGNLVEGAGNTTCTIGPVTGYERYNFYVYDQYGNSQYVTFDVYVQNHLEAYFIDDEGGQYTYPTVYVAPNESAELSVTVSADDMTGLTYEWRDGDGTPVEGAGKTTCPIGPVTGYERYYFTVSDQYGNSSSVSFYVRVQNHLNAYVLDEYGFHNNSKTVYVAPNGSAELSATVSADDMSQLTYEWRDSDYNTIEDAKKPSLMVESVIEDKYYTFTVHDQYGNSVSVNFSVCVQNNLKAYFEDEYGNQTTYPTVYTAPNGSADLSVIVSADDMSQLTYEWRDSDDNLVEGAGNTTCTIGPVTGYERYYFIVSDQYGNSKEIYFTVRVQNNLSADSEGDSSYHVTPGSPVTLKVNVSADDMTGLKYNWYTNYEETLIQGADSLSYTIESVTESNEYVFRVSDQYGNTDSVYFYVYADNNLNIYPEGNQYYDEDKTIYASPGESLDLKVISTANDSSHLSFQWYQDGEPIDGSTSSTFRINSAAKKSIYRCTVTDQYGNSRSAYFYIEIENHFNAFPEGNDPDEYSKEIFAAPGSSVNLKVTASADNLEGVTYQWFSGDDTPISNAKAASYTVNSVTERKSYKCNVKDKYGNTKYVQFYVSPLVYSGEKSIKAGDITQISVSQESPYALFKFTPTETSGYTLYSTGDDVDSYIEVFNSSYQRLFYNDDSGDGWNFKLSKVFTAGTTYYIRARAYSSDSSEDFTMYLEKDSRKSQVLSANDMTLINGSNKYITVSGAQGSLHFESSNYGVAEVSEDGEILTYRTGTSIITIYADGTDEYLPSESIKITVTVTEQIVDINTAAVSGLTARTYNGKAQTQTPVVKIGSTILRAGTDYTVSYKNNTNAGTATVTFTGKGNYTGTKSATFVINKAAQNIALKVSAASIAVGKTATVSITGAVGAKSYKSSLATVAAVNAAGTVTAKKVGSTTVTATAAATANYKAASRTVSIKVVPAATSSITAANLATGIKLTWKSVAGATGYRIYRGSKLIKTIKGGSIITCTDTTANANGTLYTFKVFPTAATGTGLGRSLAVYRIARPAVSSVKNTAAKKMTVRWKKNAKANGYQIQYSTNKKFAKGNKTANITRAATVSKVIGSLAKGKTYYVRIRTYKTVGKSKCWSAWSAAKTVKITK